MHVTDSLLVAQLFVHHSRWNFMEASTVHGPQQCSLLLFDDMLTTNLLATQLGISQGIYIVPS